MKVLPQNFELDRYGMHVRFACVDDAVFIHALRTNEKNAQFLHVDGCSIETQRVWLRNYKVKEAKGEEYYFVFERENEPIGVIRLCYFENDDYHCSSWTFRDNQPAYCALAGALIAREISFEMLEMKKEVNWRDGIIDNNRNVLLYMKMLGWKQTSEHFEGKIRFLTGVLTREDYLLNKSKVLRFIPKEYR